jgi:hypothetical protein
LPPNIPRILINRTIVHPAKSSLSQDEDDEEDVDFREDDVFDAYLLGFATTSPVPWRKSCFHQLIWNLAKYQTLQELTGVF